MKKFTIKNKGIFQATKSYAELIFCVAFFLALTTSAQAKENYSEIYKEDLEVVEKYLNSISNLSAKFIQESENSKSSGKFFLVRNNSSAGKMRVEYEGNNKALIVVNGPILSYVDLELDEVSRISTNTTPASFLTRPNISFSAKDVEITNIVKSDNRIKISLLKKNRKDAGEFSVIFDLNPLNFIEMEVKNDLQQVVKVRLLDIDFTSAISDKIFVIKNKNLQ